ncbi:Crp/Fnr family transcriptional regulator [Marinimicrobium locisalis]|uniref:Crp/Fnr family transcriptional regulator n=1 Tax=Marinimicrobium locisalis TaxID=546022 RepID=UPI0032221110
MHLPHKQSDLITDCAAHLREAGTELLSGLSPAGETTSFGVSHDLLGNGEKDRLWLITEGEAFYRVGGKQVTRHSAGDLIGLERELPVETGVYGCSEPVTLEPYHREEVMGQARFAHYLMYANAFYRASLAQEIRAEFQPSAGFMHFMAGETIIHQGSEAHQVYTLLEGKAHALRDGLKVGEINANEIFGALAVFTRQKRMASVVAVSDCTVLAVRKEEFADLVEMQPQICLGLVEELADKINQLNGQLLAQQAKG